MSSQRPHRVNELQVERLGIRKFNFKLIAFIAGTLLIYMSVSMLIPLFISLYTHDGAQYALLASALSTLTVGMLLRNIIGKNAEFELKEKESYWITAIIWVVVPLCGTLPYIFVGSLGSFTDALFESVSGFTTTGSSVITYPEELPKSLLVYRSFTQWIGGIGLLLFVIALLHKLGIAGGQLFDAEFSGTRQRKLHPHLDKSVLRLCAIYSALTICMTVLLIIFGTSLSDAICMAFSTVSTGGFLPNSQGLINISEGAFAVVTIFMIISGISLAQLYLFFTFRWRQMSRDQELRTYLTIFVAAVVACTLSFMYNGNSLGESLRYSTFHLASTMSSCGFFLPKPAHWSFLVSVLTFLLIIVGASAGSTGGGIKLWRVMAVFRYIGNYITLMMHPHSVISVKINGKLVEKEYINKIFAFVFLYLSFIVVGAFLLMLCDCSIPNAVCMAASNISNLGPSPLINNLGAAIDYSTLPQLAKWTLMVLMLAGRLELFVLIAIFSPAYWWRR